MGGDGDGGLWALRVIDVDAIFARYGAGPTREQVAEVLDCEVTSNRVTKALELLQDGWAPT